MEALKNGIKDLLDAPYDCPEADLLQSGLLEPAPIGPGSHDGGAIMETGVKDVAVETKTESVYLCNLRAYAMAYTIKGAMSIQNSPKSQGPSFPRTTLKLDGVLQGYAGDYVTLEGDFTREAFVWTVAGAALDLFPWGRILHSQLGKHLDLVVNSANVEAMRTAATSCGSTIDAAIAAQTATGNWDGPVKGAIACLLDLSDTFGAVVQEVYGKLAAQAGFKGLIAPLPGSGLIQAGFILELYSIEVHFFPPRHVSFVYQLRRGNQGFPERTKDSPNLDTGNPGGGNPGGGNTGSGASGSGAPGSGAPGSGAPGSGAPGSGGTGAIQTNPPFYCITGPGGTPGPACQSGNQGPTSGGNPSGANPPSGPTQNQPAPDSPVIVSVGLSREGALVYASVSYTDGDGDAQGFGFRGVNGSGWAQESHPFSNPSYGRVSPGRVDYPFNLACGQPNQYRSDVEFWIYDSGGRLSKSVIAHLAC